MKEIFPGFYRPSEEEFSAMWRNCLFVLDANVLLNLYRYPEQARDELLKVLRPVANRIWVPFQAALEYQRNRPGVIAEQKRRFREVRGVVESIVPKLEAEFGRLQLRERHAVIEPDGLIQKIKPTIEEFLGELNELEKSQGNVHDDDLLRQQIHELLNGRIGPAPDEKDIESICAEGVTRYDANLPPGFMDDEKEESSLGVYSYGGITYQAKFGDLILWKQILEHAQAPEIQSLIFLTDDEKMDWWWFVESQGKKKLGPRPELVDEIRRVANVSQFYIYNSEQFLKFARNYLAADVSEKSIEQVREVTIREYRRPSDFRESARLAEEAAAEWLVDQYPTARIRRNPVGWPDFTLEPDGGDERIGCEIVPLRGRMSLHSRFRDRLYRGYHDVKEGKFSSFEFILVMFGGSDDNRIRDVFESDRIKFPAGVGATLGTIVQGSDSASDLRYVPVSSRSVKFDFD